MMRSGEKKDFCRLQSFTPHQSLSVAAEMGKEGKQHLGPWISAAIMKECMKEQSSF